MSMSEFERREQESEPDLLDLLMHDSGFNLPTDFSEADLAFAQELGQFFALEEEEVPPLFVQTLLESDDPRFHPVEPGFEKKTYARVFRQLKLKRHLFHSQPLFAKGFASALPRPIMSMALACMLFMLLTVVVVSPSFASGLSYLWAGAHSGVLQVNHYPLPTQTSAARSHLAHPSDIAAPEQMTVFRAQHFLHFPMYWPTYIPAKYSQTPGDIFLYKGDRSWADGPILVSNFYNAQPGIASRQISICEFKPQGKVLQVVQDGAAHQIKIGHDGLSSAIYVEGQWKPASSLSPTWIYSDRSQLIYEDPKSGVVFWIVGDKRDGIDSNQLYTIASSLSLYDENRVIHVDGYANRVTESDDNAPSFLANDVIFLDNPDNPNGPSFKLVGAPQDQSETSHAHTTRGVALEP